MLLQQRAGLRDDVADDEEDSLPFVKKPSAKPSAKKLSTKPSAKPGALAAAAAKKVGG